MSCNRLTGLSASATWPSCSLFLCYYVTQNSKFGENWSYFMEKMSSVFSLWLLGLNSLIYGGSWKQHAGCLLHTVAAAAALVSISVLPATKRGLAHWQMEAEHQNGYQNQSQESGQCNWTQLPLLTSWQRCRYCKEEADERKETVTEQEDRQELAQTGV